MIATGNLSASIHQRILTKATIERRPFNELLQYYAIERFLYRLSQSPYSKRFVLKGALVFLAWQVPLTRPTRDIDFLGFTENSVENLIRIVREVSCQSVEPDGVVFDPESVAGEIIKEEADYQGIRIKFLGFLGKAKIPMRLDVAFADVITPSVNEVELPTILEDSIKPCIRAYPPETVIAEKFQAMAALGIVNSRMKDFYDLWYMANSMEFDFNTVRDAIEKTFKQRNSLVPKQIPTALTTEFAAQKQPQWAGFIKKSEINDAPTSIMDIIEMLRTFFDPIIGLKVSRNMRWLPATGWSE